MNRSDIFQKTTNRIITGLERGVVPWQDSVRKSYPILPTNLLTGRAYTGSNALLLQMHDNPIPYYLTWNQAKKLGGKIKHGEVPIEVIFWDINVTHKETREPIAHDVYLSLPKCQKLNYYVRPIGRFYSVYNVSQTEGLDIPKPMRELPLNQKLELCEQVVLGYQSKPVIQHKPGIASYVPSLDEVWMPEINAYEDSESYYSVLFHELGHSSGHRDRLNRPGVTGSIKFGSQEYSEEELVAEITANFLCAHCQIMNKVIDNSLAYISSWISELRNDKYMIIKAANQAQKAYNLIINGGSL